jgi:CDP-diacylglycerol--glycerol-3-phosphate 3-phosphatidyltransferase
MNLPNKLTLLRVLFIPAIMVFLLVEAIPFRWLIGGLCFGAAALTDFFDGRIARKNNLITDFGKLMDPVADKMLIMSTLICFVQENLCGAWVVAVILFREFLITSMRMIAADKGKVIAANIWGKIKTVTQMIAIVGFFCAEAALEFSAVFPVIPEWIGKWLLIFSHVILYTAVAATIFSGVRYMYDAKEFFRDA